MTANESFMTANDMMPSPKDGQPFQSALPHFGKGSQSQVPEPESPDVFVDDVEEKKKAEKPSFRKSITGIGGGRNGSLVDNEMAKQIKAAEEKHKQKLKRGKTSAHLSGLSRSKTS